jgi:hypothetical protein
MEYENQMEMAAVRSSAGLHERENKMAQIRQGHWP